MTVCGESRCTSFPPPSLHRPHKPQHVGMVVVHRRRRDADHVRLAPVAEHALGGDEVEQRATRVAAGQAAAFDDSQRELGSATFGLARGGDLQRVRQRSEEHTSELPSLMSISSAVYCLKKTNMYVTFKYVRRTTTVTRTHS